ncbi:hypothetical protein RINTHM_14810 [Richelia intracellularis HM01]|nr:hypothetical protein RINTHM_14810 [Richelia intracellularis HM01]
MTFLQFKCYDDLLIINDKVNDYGRNATAGGNWVSSETLNVSSNS